MYAWAHGRNIVEMPLNVSNGTAGGVSKTQVLLRMRLDLYRYSLVVTLTDLCRHIGVHTTACVSLNLR